MKKIHYIFIAIILPLISISLAANVSIAEKTNRNVGIGGSAEVVESRNINTPTPISTATPTPFIVPAGSVIPREKHMFQTFNNCGPASLSMLLSYYGVDVTQQTLGNYLRPLQNPQGNNDDKSVSLGELAKYAEENYGLVAYQRPAGDMDTLKKLIANDMPVIVRTWLELGEDIGHYRVVRGYDDNIQVIIQDDSYQGKDLSISYSEFEQMWMPFSWEFMVLVEEDKIELVEEILGDNVDIDQAWQEVYQRSSGDSNFAVFNRSRSQYYLGNYQESIALFESVQSRLPGRMLWYQYEPIRSYLETGRYDKVFSLTSNILNNNNLAYSELYIIRGKAYQAQGNLQMAKEEYQKAIQYNVNLEEPRRLLSEIGEN